MPKKRAHGDGGLYYLESRKLWRGVIDLPPTDDGRRRQAQVHARTQRACKEKLDSLRAELKANGGQPLKRGRRLDDWAIEWFRDYAQPNLDPNTFRSYRGLFDNWVKPAIGRKPVDTIEPRDVTRVLRDIRTAGRALSTSKSAYIVLDKMLEEARVQKLCATNPVRDVARPGAGRKAKGKQLQVARQRDAFDAEVGMALLAAAAQRRNGSMYWFKLLTGPRQGEMLGAVLEDLHIDETTGTGVYEVNWKLEELASDHGCGQVDADGTWPCGKKRGGSCTHRVFRVPDDFEMRQLDGRLHLTEPKSQTGKRVPLIAPLVDIIRRDLAATAHLPNPHGLLWRHADGSPILPREEQDGWRSLLVEVGFIEPEQAIPGGTEWTGHTARHSVITLLYTLGVDEQLIGEIVGQSTTEVTRSYRHARDEERLAAMQKLGERLLTELPELPAAV
jgi:integrase